LPSLPLVLALALSSGCGFHLRGGVPLPASLSPLEVQGASNVLEERLRIFLGDAGVRMVRNDEKPASTLVVKAEDFHQRVLSVDSHTGKAREFELIYSVSFQLEGPEAKPILPQRQVTLVRDYTFDTNAVIGTSRERGVLETEMRRDAAAAIVRRLNAELGA
jgi:LPS-assembly lipoprotein